jgi:hypothetical protein
MRTYLVQWEIDIDADSPQEAAERARFYQTKPDTTATVFTIFEPTHSRNPRDGAVRVARIDLSFPKESQIFKTTRKAIDAIDDRTDNQRAV